MLIEADLGPAAAARIAGEFAARRFGRSCTEREIKETLAESVAEGLLARQGAFEPLAGPRPFVVLFIGVNGSGKTTTLGKIAADLVRREAKVLIAAGDTFPRRRRRAARGMGQTGRRRFHLPGDRG